ncbi:MAG: GntR family transcriptional regulator [Clostridia bacterium]|nr:GntR family transcriptional regulator [Clostridia bacterium]
MKFNFSGNQDIYLEIAERYKEYIRKGVLQDGDKLPSVRVAAGELSVNPNTVAKAYAKLEQDGYICSLPKKGVYVTYEGSEPKPKQPDPDFAQICAMRDRGVDKQTILAWIEEAYGEND